MNNQCQKISKSLQDSTRDQFAKMAQSAGLNVSACTSVVSNMEYDAIKTKFLKSGAFDMENQREQKVASTP